MFVKKQHISAKIQIFFKQIQAVYMLNYCKDKHKNSHYYIQYSFTITL